MRVLITGVTGFAGSFLADYFLARRRTEPEIEVWGVSQNPPTGKTPFPFIHGDLTDPLFTRDVFSNASPDQIYHLAAQAFVPVSWQDPWATLENNIRAETNLLYAAVQLQSQARILIVASNEEYGRVTPADLPIDEDTPLRPDSPYAVSKIAQDYLGLQYFISHKLQTVRVRPFNHIGPRQDDRFVSANFAKQIAEMELGAREKKLCVGNLDAQRDFTDVRDMVRAYALALERGTAGEVYNIGSGVPHAVKEIVETYRRLSKVSFDIEYDAGRSRPSDTPVSYCDPRKFKMATGWEPTIPFEQTLQDILEYWRWKIAVASLPAI